MLSSKIKLKTFPDILQNIPALILVKVRGKNRKKAKNNNFRHDFEVQVGDIVVDVHFTSNLNFRAEFSTKVKTLLICKKFLLTWSTKERFLKLFRSKNGKRGNGSYAGLLCSKWLRFGTASSFKKHFVSFETILTDV